MSSTVNREATVLIYSLYLCHPFHQKHDIVRAQSWFCFSWFHIWKLKWKKRLLKLTLIPARWLALQSPTRKAQSQLIQLSSTKVFPSCPWFFFNFFHQSVKFHEHKTCDFHLKIVNSQCSLLGLLNSALIQLLYLKCWVTKKARADFVDASVTYNRFNVFPLWRTQIRLSHVFWPVVSIWYMSSGQDSLHEHK